MPCRKVAFVFFFGVFGYFGLLNLNVLAQGKPKISEEVVESWFNNISDIPFDINTLINLDNLEKETILRVTARHISDTLFESRWLGISLVNQIGALTECKPIIQNSLSLVIRFLFDKDTRICFQASESLLFFSDVHFKTSQKDSIAELLLIVKQMEVLNNLFKICGKHDIHRTIPNLIENAYNKQNPFIIRWSSLASLTRMGNIEAEGEMLKYIKNVGFSLDAISSLYPYIMFTKSRLIVNYLIEEIKYNVSICESSNPNVTNRIPCAYHILKVIGPEIEGLGWSGPDGLEMLDSKNSLEKAKNYFNNIGDNWTFISE